MAWPHEHRIITSVTEQPGHTKVCIATCLQRLAWVSQLDYRHPVPIADVEAALIALLTRPTIAQNLTYAPQRVTCPDHIQWLRPASNGLGPSEAEWLYRRKQNVLKSLEQYLHRLNLKCFNVCDWMCRMRSTNYSNVPTIGFAVSGGGWASAFTGAGGLRALDDRLPEANAQGTGGLLQSLTYCMDSAATPYLRC